MGGGGAYDFAFVDVAGAVEEGVHCEFVSCELRVFVWRCMAFPGCNSRSEIRAVELYDWRPARYVD